MQRWVFHHSTSDPDYSNGSSRAVGITAVKQLHHLRCLQHCAQIVISLGKISAKSHSKILANRLSSKLSGKSLSKIGQLSATKNSKTTKKRNKNSKNNKTMNIAERCQVGCYK